MGRRLALLIATYQYQDAGLRRLTSPAHDTEALAAVLEDPAIAGFDVTTLINEPHHRVGQTIGEFYRGRRRDDLTLLYFTGHGLKDDAGRLYLAMTNTMRDNLLFTGLSAEQIDLAMENCASRQKVLILDCCYGGAFPAGRLAKADTEVHALGRFHGRGRTVLTASDSTQYSFEGDSAHGEVVQSVFTRHLVAGLRDGSADLDGDGDITLDELYSYVHDRVVAEMPQQRPKKQDNVEGRTVIARNINWTLPAHLRNALASPIATDRLNSLDGLEHYYRIGNAIVRRTVLDAIQGLIGDDSRAVCSAATERLAALQAKPFDAGVETTSEEIPVAKRQAGDTRRVQPSPVAPESGPVDPLTPHREFDTSGSRPTTRQPKASTVTEPSVPGNHRQASGPTTRSGARATEPARPQQLAPFSASREFRVRWWSAIFWAAAVRAWVVEPRNPWHKVRRALGVMFYLLLFITLAVVLLWNLRAV